MPEELEDDDLEAAGQDLEDPDVAEELLDDEDVLASDDEDDAEVDLVEADDLVGASVAVDDDVAVGADDDEAEDSDVEASLDVILRERLVVMDTEEDEEDEDTNADPLDRGDSAVRIVPKQATEFLCSSCFLVKHRSQLADEANRICRDCI